MKDKCQIIESKIIRNMNYPAITDKNAAGFYKFLVDLQLSIVYAKRRIRQHQKTFEKCSVSFKPKDYKKDWKSK